MHKSLSTLHTSWRNLVGNWPACSSTRRPAKPRKELASVPANQGMPVNRVMLLIQAFLREVIKVDAGIDPTPGC